MYEVSDAYKSAIALPSRNFRLSGNIRLQSGDTITLSDSNVVGEMKIETQCMSGSSSEQILDIGAVCAAKLTMTVKSAGGSDSFADARVRPLVGLEISEDNFEDIPMGIFYVDNTTVERVKDRVTFSAYDKMIFLHFLLTDTMRGNMKNMPPFAACAYVCGLAGIRMAQSSAAVTAFPNGSVLPDYSDASIETARDLVMWCAQLMGCFARIDRHGKLEFVQLKAENDEHGMIIPVREIAARQRYSTRFADGVIRITRLTMKKSDGKTASAAVTYTGSTKRSAELELEQNPLILSLTDKTVKECLKDILGTVKTAYFRPFQSEIASDPALDAGDYVRLRGGSIDTNRGYGTGIITHNIWRYRGKHSIVNVGSVPAMYQLDDESSATEIAAVSEIALLSANSEDDDSGSDDVDGTDLVYVQPKSQLEKEIDGLKGKAGAGSGVGKAVEDDPTCEYFNDYEANNITPYGIAAYHHVEGRGNSCGSGTACHAEGYGNFVRYGTGLRVEGSYNTLDTGEASSVGGKGNNVKRLDMSRVDGSGNKVDTASSSHILGSENTVTNSNESIICGKSNTVNNSFSSLIAGMNNKVEYGHQVIVQGNENEINFYVGEVLGNHNTVTPAQVGECYVYGERNDIKSGYIFAFGFGLVSRNLARSRVMFGEYNVARSSFGRQPILLLLGNGRSDQERSSCFAVDYNGNVYCKHIYETGTSNIEDYFTNNPAPASQTARTFSPAANAEIPIVLLDHTPTADDLTGSECVFLQCADTAEVEGEATGIFRVTDIFAEKSLR